ncbi:hypothetical protein A6E01_19125 (plasmid) [Vibrio breoganii]|uniref:Beta sliding clamp n=2 Tax=Vibrio breoganii TaxID=553239 RepID=A0AAN0XZF2_9VIBR|nr:hypothetical protein A6E01_19125 [Vibrio breoganii]
MNTFFLAPLEEDGDQLTPGHVGIWIFLAIKSLEKGMKTTHKFKWNNNDLRVAFNQVSNIAKSKGSDSKMYDVIQCHISDGAAQLECIGPHGTIFSDFFAVDSKEVLNFSFCVVIPKFRGFVDSCNIYNESIDVNMTYAVDDADTVKVTGRFKKKTVTMTSPAQTMPSEKTFLNEPDSTIRVNRKDLIASLTAIAPACASGTTKMPSLRGVNLWMEAGRLSMVGSDTHILIYRSIAVEHFEGETSGCVIVAGTAQLLSQLLNSYVTDEIVEIQFSMTKLVLRSPYGLTVSLKLIGEQLVPANPIIGKTRDHNVVTVDRAELLGSCKLLGRSSPIAKVSVESDKLRLEPSYHGDLRGTDQSFESVAEMALENQNGANLEVGIALHQLMLALAVTSSESVSLGVLCGNSAMTVRCNDDKTYIALVMPCRL